MTTEMHGRTEAKLGGIYCVTVRMRTGRGEKENWTFPFCTVLLARVFKLTLRKRKFFEAAVRNRKKCVILTAVSNDSKLGSRGAAPFAIALDGAQLPGESALRPHHRAASPQAKGPAACAAGRG